MKECQICYNIRGSKVIEHHVIPKNKGGRDNPGNKIPICLSCHQSVERQTIGGSMRATLQQLGKDRDWFFLKLAELGITTNPYWNKNRGEQDG